MELLERHHKCTQTQLCVVDEDVGKSAMLTMFFCPSLVSNLELLLSLPGGDSVRGFFLVTLLVEKAAVPALTVKSFLKHFVVDEARPRNIMVDLVGGSMFHSAFQSIPVVINGVRDGDIKAVTRALEDISHGIKDMTDKLKLMHGRKNRMAYTPTPLCHRALTIVTCSTFVF